MKHRDLIQSALESAWRRPLTSGETAQVRAALGADPAQHRAWAEEQGLSLLLEGMPEAPMPARFTAEVLAALDRAEASPAKRANSWRPLWPGDRPLLSWVPRFALATALLLALPAIWFHRHAEVNSRFLNSAILNIAEPVHQAGLVVQWSGVDILRDFEAINRMRQVTTHADEELLASLEFIGP